MRINDVTKTMVPTSGPSEPEIGAGDGQGTRVAGPHPDRGLGVYLLRDVIGRGGMGVVYRATHVHLGREVALKILAPELSGHHDFRERFLRESRMAASLEHPNVVTVYDAGDWEGTLYIAMRYVEGTDLAKFLGHEAPLDPPDSRLDTRSGRRGSRCRARSWPDPSGRETRERVDRLRALLPD